MYMRDFLNIYLYSLLCILLRGVLDKNSEFIDKFIEQAVSNANSETRLNGRKSFLVW